MRSNDLIYIEILDKAGHDDLKFCIRDLTADLCFDTYYFRISMKQMSDIKSLRAFVAHFLQSWIAKIAAMKSGEDRYIPIDLSDQYTGCMKVSKKENLLEISYGYSLKEGWRIMFENASDYFSEITDFKSNINKKLVVTETDLLSSLQSQVNKLLS
jgi:hypothetical protein